MDALAVEPSLPPELERQIFEISALSSPVGMLNLMLVAWRVKYWTGWISVLDPDTFLAVIGTKHATFFHENMKNLLLTEFWSVRRSPATYQAILAACPGVTNLFLVPAMHPHVDALEHLAPRRLAINVDLFFYNDPKDFSHPLFHHATHLEMVDDRWEDILNNLPLMPNLTHLAFDDSSAIHMYADSARLCGKLECIVFSKVDHPWGWRTHEDLIDTLLEDIRFVMIGRSNVVADWQICAYNAGDDHWIRAETIIAERRAGTIVPTRVGTTKWFTYYPSEKLCQLYVNDLYHSDPA
ncbi:hypothetical protein C8R43DRAFT_1234086 [Mycena crocata]|nr:hypothetical protein C8R43DRAFT_1234086 [Mycena crocata]